MLETINAVVLATVGVGYGFWIGLVGCEKIGRALANARETQSVPLDPEPFDDEFLFVGRPNYSGIRESVLRADEAARMA